MKFIEFEPFWQAAENLAKNTTNSDSEDPEKRAKESFLITFIFMMLVYHIIAAAFEKYSPSWGHQTSVIVVLGIIWSLVLYAIHGGSSHIQIWINAYSFPTNLFF
jgi:hypothetical protein